MIATLLGDLALFATTGVGIVAAVFGLVTRGDHRLVIRSRDWQR